MTKLGLAIYISIHTGSVCEGHCIESANLLFRRPGITPQEGGGGGSTIHGMPSDLAQ